MQQKETSSKYKKDIKAGASNATPVTAATTTAGGAVSDRSSTTGVQHISVVGKYYVARGTRALSRADIALPGNIALALAAAE